VLDEGGGREEDERRPVEEADGTDAESVVSMSEKENVVLLFVVVIALGGNSPRKIDNKYTYKFDI
jgi:hypothetical protein